MTKLKREYFFFKPLSQFLHALLMYRTQKFSATVRPPGEPSLIHNISTIYQNYMPKLTTPTLTNKLDQYANSWFHISHTWPDIHLQISFSNNHQNAQGEGQLTLTLTQTTGLVLKSKTEEGIVFFQGSISIPSCSTNVQDRRKQRENF